MAPIVLYYYAPSAPCRIALFTMRCLGIDVEIRHVNLLKQEHLKDDFLKINPIHMVPTIVDDDGHILSESRAIAIYLIEKLHPNGHSFYPKCAKERAVINQHLNYDCGTFYQRIRAVAQPAWYRGQTTISDEARKNVYDSVELLNRLLQGKSFIVGGDQPTLADLSYFSSMANLFELGVDMSKYPNVVQWYKKCKQLPGSDENIQGAKEYAERINSILIDRL